MTAARKSFPARFAVLPPIAALMLLSATACGPSAPPQPANIVLVLADDLGWADLGVTGSRYYETPSIDALAAAGVLFTDAYSNGPNCEPSRASLLTGLYPPRTGIYTVGTAARGPARGRKLVPVRNRDDLSLGFVTLAERLSEAGYATAHIGKWHLGGEGQLPTDQGFDLNVAGNEFGGPPSYFYPYAAEGLQLPGLGNGTDGEYLTDRLTDEAFRFVRQHADQPFFLYLSHFAVHTPIQGKPELVARFADKPPVGGQDNPEYAAMVSSLDQSVGRLVALLQELDLSEQTLLIFFSDNGGHGRYTSNAPLRGEKNTLYEGGLRVPLIVRWPEHTRPGDVCGTPVIGLDLYPTALAAAGLALPDELDGISLVPELERCGSTPERPLFWHFPAYVARGGSHDGPWRARPTGVIRRGNLKLLEFFEDSNLELYDLAADLGEQVNLAAERPQDAQRLLEEMRRWRAATDAPVPTELEPQYRPHRRDRRNRRPGRPQP